MLPFVKILTSLPITCIKVDCQPTRNADDDFHFFLNAGVELCKLFNLCNMKTGILLAILVICVSANGQTLKDALFGGKLKMDTGTVLRKGDDWASKIDTSSKKPVEPGKKILTPVTDSSMTHLATQLDSAAISTGGPKDNQDAAAISAAGPRDNNKIWKNYIDSLTGTLKAEVLSSKKIKSGTYSVLIEYEIGLDGQITINNVSCSPESVFLGQQIKERLILTAPQMNPLLTSNGKPRVAIKKQMLTLSK